MLGLYCGTILYPLARLWYWLGWYTTWGTLLLLALLGIPFVFGLLRFMTRVKVPGLRSNALLTWQGLCFVLFPVVLVGEIVNLVAPIEHLQLGFFALAAWALVAVFCFYHASRLFVRTVKVKTAVPATGKKVVQLTDVHIGSRSVKFLENVVAQVEKLQPDYVVITGDLVDSSSVTKEHLEPLARLTAPTFFTIGNHERYEDCETIVNWLESLGINVLRNRSVDFAPFQFVGIDDAESPHKVRMELETIKKIENRLRILLYHRPLGAEDASSWGFHLMLSGHTHRGQIFPFNFLVNRFFKYTHGDHEIDGMHLHVSTGTGTWGPQMRLGSRNEVTQLVFESDI